MSELSNVCHFDNTSIDSLPLDIQILHYKMRNDLLSLEVSHLSNLLTIYRENEQREFKQLCKESRESAQEAIENIAELRTFVLQGA